VRFLHLERVHINVGKRDGFDRGKSLRVLRWDDIASDPPTITWRKEFDKRRREQTIPIPASLADEIRVLRAKLGAFGDDWLFPQSAGDHPSHRKCCAVTDVTNAIAASS